MLQQVFKIFFLICFSLNSVSQNLSKDQHQGTNFKLNSSKKLEISKVNFLDSLLYETSGLFYHDHFLYTHNDSSESFVYQLDSLGVLLKNIQLPLRKNVDWEEIQFFENHLYLGDIGNNSTGNRTNLSIYKIAMSDLDHDKMVVDTIQFYYDRQVISNSKNKRNKTNFDAEAFIVTSDFIYVFTKEWQSKRCSLYKFPNKKGRHVAHFQAEFDVNGLVTGACFLRKQNVLLLCGYSRYLKPFVVAFNQFENDHFFEGNYRKYSLQLPFHQIEAITYDGQNRIYLTNETFQRRFIRKRAAALFKIELDSILLP